MAASFTPMAVLSSAGGLLAQALELPLAALQRLIGIRRMPWVFLTPNLLIIGLFALVRVLLNVFYSVSGGDGFYPNQRSFVGLDNFAITLQCDDYLQVASCRRDLFWRAAYNTLAFVPIQVGVLTVLALTTAVVLNRPIRGRGFYRAVFFFPVMLSPVVVALIWKWILQRQGLLNAAMVAAHGSPVEWLSSPQSAFFWSIFITVWARLGFYTLILLAGLQAIPRDVYEAARMDSAKPWRMFFSITLPLLRPTLLVVIVLALIASVQTFDELYVLTGGGPGSATVLLIQYIFETGFATLPRNLGLAGRRLHPGWRCAARPHPAAIALCRTEL